MCWLRMEGRDENELESAIRGERRRQEARSAMGCGTEDVVRGERRKHRAVHALDAGSSGSTVKEVREMSKRAYHMEKGNPHEQDSL